MFTDFRKLVQVLAHKKISSIRAQVSHEQPAELVLANCQRCSITRHEDGKVETAG